MNKLFSRYNVSRKRVLTAAGLLLLCLGLNNYLMPTVAGNSQSVDSQLEVKILQVIRKHPEVVMESVKAYQLKKQEQQQKAQMAFLKRMKANPKSVIGFSPTTVAPEQKIVLVNFSDFQCPYCAKAHKVLKQFMTKYKDKVTLVYKHFPLNSTHPEATPSAKASWAAQQQGKFWEFHDALFENQDKLSESFYIATAKALNLDIKRFNQDRNSSAATEAINNDIELAQEIGVDATPRLAMNGEPVNGDIQIDNLEAILTQINKR
ncbi:MAG: thioredoxin domain-containing protein [Calothrix sp. C42_A2020_038]|nr:thioredoxin domain-containing protein [Calothrix sp. C42_A2020_038]